MRFVTIAAYVPDLPADEVFETLADYGRYSDLTPVVRSVDVWFDEAGDMISRWEVNFRSGILRWIERDVIDRNGLRITFDQVEGDVAELSGTWAIDAVPGGTAVRFDAAVDLGIPSLAAVLDPIAARTLLETISALLLGLYGDSVRFDDVTDHGSVAPAAGMVTTGAM